METQTGIKLSCEVIEGLESLAEQVAKSGASIDEVKGIADALHQAFLEFYHENEVSLMKLGFMEQKG